MFVMSSVLPFLGWRFWYTLYNAAPTLTAVNKGIMLLFLPINCHSRIRFVQQSEQSYYVTPRHIPFALKSIYTCAKLQVNWRSKDMYPKAYVDYLVHFHGLRDYFECHEILEEHWKEDPRGDRKPHWVGLIQIAVGLYHHRRGNFAGAKRMLTNAKRIAIQERESLEHLSLEVDTLIGKLTKQIQHIEQNDPYVSIDLPITSPELLKLCDARCTEVGCVYGSPSDLTNEFIVHKHTKRDRTEVIEERDQQYRIRNEKRNG